MNRKETMNKEHTTLEDFREAWRLFHQLKDKDKFNKLTLDEKLEALRIGVIQEGK